MVRRGEVRVGGKKVEVDLLSVMKILRYLQREDGLLCSRKLLGERAGTGLVCM